MGSEFLKDLATCFAQTHGTILKIAYVEVLLRLIHPIANVSFFLSTYRRYQVETDSRISYRPQLPRSTIPSGLRRSPSFELKQGRWLRRTSTGQLDTLSLLRACVFRPGRSLWSSGRRVSLRVWRSSRFVSSSLSLSTRRKNVVDRSSLLSSTGSSRSSNRRQYHHATSLGLPQSMLRRE